MGRPATDSYVVVHGLHARWGVGRAVDASRIVDGWIFGPKRKRHNGNGNKSVNDFIGKRIWPASQLVYGDVIEMELLPKVQTDAQRLLRAVHKRTHNGAGRI